MINYNIINPIGRLGNHIITYINTIFLHTFLCKDNYANNYYISLNNNDILLKKKVIINDNIINDSRLNNGKGIIFDKYSNNICSIPCNIISRTINGYDIFHLSNLFISKNIQYKICFNDYLKLCNNYIPLLWEKTTITKFKIESKKYFINYIFENYINLDTTLFIHIKCTDNTIPDKVIHKKYNIYHNKIYLEICKKYNYDSIIIITDNPNHAIIQNLLSYKTSIRILCPSSNMINDIYFLINAKNLLIDNSTFTWICGMHPFIYNHISNNKTLFFYKDFFEKFLLDINTKPWAKNILNLCITSEISQLKFNLETQYIDFKKIRDDDEININVSDNINICNCEINNKKTISISRYINNILYYKNKFNVIIFDYNSNIKIGEWIGNNDQINSLLL